MSKVNVIYWSGTGNTETMAEAVGQGIEKAGFQANVVSVDNVSVDLLEGANIFALGCPSMGGEELEEDSMEPFVKQLESKVSGKKILLFGSYDWGDGEWMRNWTERMENAGAIVTDSIIVNNAPEASHILECQIAGENLVK